MKKGRKPEILFMPHFQKPITEVCREAVMDNMIEVDFRGKYRDLELVLMPGRFETAELDPYYQEAFKTWKLVWEQTLKELDGLDYLPSDAFTRQDLVAGLFLRGKCIALTCFRKSFLGDPVNQMDSWFKPFPKDLMDDLGRRYPYGAANSFFTIHPDYRKTKDGQTRESAAPEVDFDLATFIAELTGVVSHASMAPVTYGVTRNNRSINKVAYAAGAIPILKDQQHHGVAVDLIGFHPENVAKVMENFLPATKMLWARRIEMVKYTFEKDVENAQAA